MIARINNNPFRVLGVFSNATIKEITANKGKITAFAKVGKSVDFPADMSSILSAPDRTLQNVEDALAAINLPLDKLKYALFWFANSSPIDDVALKHLQVGNTDKALEIFNKKATFSSLLNMSVCSFISDDKGKALDCISLLIHTEEYRKEFISAICGETFIISEDELATMFIEELLTTYKASDLIDLFSISNNDTNYLKAHIIQENIDHISSEINKARNSGESANAQLKAGRSLIKNTKSALVVLKKYMSSSDLQYQTTVDALARQVLQSGINYFNTTKEEDAVKKALVLQEYALCIAVSKLLKDRCAENVGVLNSQVNLSGIRKELEKIASLIESFNSDDTYDIYDNTPLWRTLPGDSMQQSILSNLYGKPISKINQFISDCKMELDAIKNKKGDDNEYYINFSDTIAVIALNQLIESLNKRQSASSAYGRCSTDILEALDVMKKLDSFTLKTQTREHYNRNNKILKNMFYELPSSNEGNNWILWVFLAIFVFCGIMYLLNG